MRSIIATVTAAESRLLTTVDDLKAMLNDTPDAPDEKLLTAITQASAAIETACNRVFAKQRYAETLRLDGALDVISLQHYPASIVSIVHDGVTLDAEDWELDAKAGLLYRLDGSDAPLDWTGEKIVVTYDGGYVLPSFTGGSGEPLPADLQRACQILAKTSWQNDGRDVSVLRETVPDILDITYAAPGGNAMPFAGALPEEIAGLIQPYRALRV